MKDVVKITKKEEIFRQSQKIVVILKQNITLICRSFEIFFYIYIRILSIIGVSPEDFAGLVSHPR